MFAVVKLLGGLVLLSVSGLAVQAGYKSARAAACFSAGITYVNYPKSNSSPAPSALLLRSIQAPPISAVSDTDTTQAVRRQAADTASSPVLGTVHIRAAPVVVRLRAAQPTQILADSLGRFAVAGWTLDAALQQAEGVYIRDYGGVTGLKTVSLRGLAANQTNLLIEGVPYEPGLTGTVNLGAFSLEGFQSVAVEHLPLNASINPLAGSVNLGVSPTGNQLQLGGAWNSLGRVRSRAAVQHREDSAGVALGAYYSGVWAADTFGFDLNGEQGVRANAHYRQHNGLVAFNWRSTGPGSRQYRLRYRGLASQSRQRIPGPVLTGNPNANQGERFRQWALFHFAELAAAEPLAPHWRQELRLRLKHQQEYAQTDALRQDVYRMGHGWLEGAYSLHNTHWRRPLQRLRLVGQLAGTRIGGNNLARELQAVPAVRRLEGHLGLEVRGLVLAPGPGAWKQEASEQNTEKITLDGQFRLNAVEEQGVHPNGGLALRVPLWSPRLTLQAKGGRSVRIPAFNELYFAGFGNSQLKPEATWMGDLSLYYARYLFGGSAGGRSSRIGLKLSGFWARTENKIVSIPLSPVRWSTLQIGRTQSRGLELAADFRWSRYLTAFLSYTRQEVLDRTVTQRAWVPYSPPEILAAGLTASWRNLGLTLNLQRSGWRYTSLQNDAANFLPGFWTVDVLLGWRPQLGPALLDLRVALQNLAGANYALIQSFPMPGRSLQLSLGVRY